MTTSSADEITQMSNLARYVIKADKWDSNDHLYKMSEAYLALLAELNKLKQTS